MTQERDIVRDLARQILELAQSDEFETRRARWRAVNGLRKPDRAPVWCKPVGCWPELLPDSALQCQEHPYRNLERLFCQHLVKEEIGDDSVFDPCFDVGAVFQPARENIWGVEVRRIPPTQPGGAWKYDPPLKTEEDFDRLVMPEYTYDENRTQENLAGMQDLLGDILPVRLTCGPGLHTILCNMAADLRGLQPLMMDMAVRPDLVHRLMTHLRDGVTAVMKAREATGLLTLNNTDPMVCSDPIHPDAADRTVRLSDLWGSSNSQEFDQVSPAMWEEFLLDYQKPLLVRFGLTAYGCCENLTRKIAGVLSIPNLRVFVCSAWTDLAKVVEAVGTNYAVMWRQKASDVVFAPDTTPIRKHLEEGMRKARGCCVQIVLRELQTLNGRPDRLKQWATIAKDVAAQFA